MFLSPLISVEHSGEDEEESFLILFYNHLQSSHACKFHCRWEGNVRRHLLHRKKKRAANKNNNKIAKQTPQDPN